MTKRLCYRNSIAFIIVAVFLAGCGQSDPNIQTPEISLLTLGKVKLQGFSGTSTMQIRLSNPNPDPVTLEGIVLNLEAYEKPFCNGMSPINRSLPAFSSVDIDVPGTISNMAVLRAGIQAVTTGKIKYEMKTTVSFRDSTGKRHSRTNEKSGRIDSSFLNN